MQWLSSTVLRQYDETCANLLLAEMRSISVKADETGRVNFRELICRRAALIAEYHENERKAKRLNSLFAVFPGAEMVQLRQIKTVL